MINLMVGSNFDPKLPYEFFKLNNLYFNTRISEVYGSIKKLKIFGSARPDFRIPDISFIDFEKQVSDYINYNIKVNYTENIPIVDKSKIDKIYIKDLLSYIEGVGVSRLTLAHPLAMELVCELSNMPIEVSTIYAISKPYQIRELIKRCPNINKICVDVDINRNFNLIHDLQKEGIELELLANEFCIHDCVDRVQCYNDHAQVKTEDEAAQFKRYPMGRCIKERMEPIEWLRARFILPQWMSWYDTFVSINHFKITGRTHPTEYIIWITKQYMKQNYKGNLLQLWADVKNIKRVSKGEGHLTPSFEINTNKLDENFLWMYYNDLHIHRNLDLEYKFLKTYL